MIRTSSIRFPSAGASGLKEVDSPSVAGIESLPPFTVPPVTGITKVFFTFRITSLFSTLMFCKSSLTATLLPLAKAAFSGSVTFASPAAFALKRSVTSAVSPLTVLLLPKPDTVTVFPSAST